MKTLYFLAILWLFAPEFLVAQLSDSAAKAQECSCTQAFDELVLNVTTNYPGFKDKVTNGTKSSYDELTKRLYREAEHTTLDDCLYIAKEWIGFFKDRHLSISLAQKGKQFSETNPEKIREYFKNVETLTITEENFKEYLQKNAAKLDAIEGIWETQSRNYRVAIVRNQTSRRDFAAVILRADSIFWMPGQVKLEFKKQSIGYRAAIYLRDHSKDIALVQIDNQISMNLAGAVWEKVYPVEAKNITQKHNQSQSVAPLAMIALKRLSDSTLLLRIPSFEGSLYKIIDSIIRSNRALMLATPNLIIDIRNNSGGSSSNYQELLPLLYTHPIITHSSYVYVTDENIKCYEEFAANSQLRPETRTWAERILNRIRFAPRGSYVCKDSATTDTTRFPSILPYPKNVAIIINRGCGSSAENFVEEAKFSKKVTLFGENTGGFFDYGEIYSRTLKCGTLRLHCPTAARPLYLPRIDNIGFAPDVRLDATTSDWVEFAKNTLEKSP